MTSSKTCPSRRQSTKLRKWTSLERSQQAWCKHTWNQTSDHFEIMRGLTEYQSRGREGHNFGYLHVAREGAKTWHRGENQFTTEEGNYTFVNTNRAGDSTYIRSQTRLRKAHAYVHTINHFMTENITRTSTESAKTNPNAYFLSVMWFSHIQPHPESKMHARTSYL